MWLATGILVIVVAAGGTMLFLRLSGPSPLATVDVARDRATAARGQPAELQLNPAPFYPAASEPVADQAKPRAGAPLEDVVEYVKRGIVKIETSDTWNNRRGLGSGFVIDASGLVATNYHVMSDAAKADVVFNDGTRFGVEGYLAIDRRSDLAIIKLNGVPANVKALELRYGEGPPTPRRCMRSDTRRTMNSQRPAASWDVYCALSSCLLTRASGSPRRSMRATTTYGFSTTPKLPRATVAVR